jgi:two-component system sensor histidine kinase KdpD
VWLKSDDVVRALMEFARENKITRIIIGRTHQTLWNRLFRRSVSNKLIAQAADFDIELFGRESAEEAQ